MVKFLDLKAGYKELREEIDCSISRVMNSGNYILGPEVSLFEEEFAKYCGSEYAVGVGNGLDALKLSLLAMGVEPGDEIIVPAHTYIATWIAVSQCGAVPVPVEPAANSYNIDIERIEEAITQRTKVIIPVHLYGQPVSLGPLLELANSNGLMVLEDAAQAHGATYKGNRIGSHGHAVAWSFYPGKNLGAFGDAGAVTTNNAELARNLRLLRNYGSGQKYYNELPGFNSRLDPIQAAILRVKLKNLNRWNARRADIARVYKENLTGLELKLPAENVDSQAAWHLFVVSTESRDQLSQYLLANGVETLVHYPVPPHKQKAYANTTLSQRNYPISEKLARTVLSLPIYPQLSNEDQEATVQIIKKYFNEAR